MMILGFNIIPTARNKNRVLVPSPVRAIVVLPWDLPAYLLSFRLELLTARVDFYLVSLLLDRFVCVLFCGLV